MQFKRNTKPPVGKPAREVSPKEEKIGKDSKLYKRVYRLSLLGLTEAEIALALDVKINTLYKWKKEDPKFAKALTRGKYDADSKVAESLYRRALGFTVKETKLNVIDGNVEATEVDKHYPPDVRACIAWLRVRQREKWTEKIHVKVGIKNNGEELPLSNEPLDLSMLSDAELELASKLAFRGLSKQEAQEVEDNEIHFINDEDDNDDFDND